MLSKHARSHNRVRYCKDNIPAHQPIPKLPGYYEYNLIFDL
jgi:hypothetical protein